MEKTESKIKRFIRIIFNFYVVLSLLIIVFGISIYFYINLKTYDDKLSNKITKLEKNLLVVKTNEENKNNELLELKKEEDMINNLESEIEKTKSEFFQNAKKYEDLVLAGKGSKKIAYLTFDDGPYQLTYKFLDILDEYDILATFFVIGNKPNDRLPIYTFVTQRMTVRGHERLYAFFLLLSLLVLDQDFFGIV